MALSTGKGVSSIGRMPTPKEDRVRVVAAPPPSLCLDFVNTRCWRGMPQPSEELRNFDALHAWLQRHGVLDSTAAASLQALDGDAAPALLQATCAAREDLYLLLRALAAGEAPPRHTLAALTEWLAAAPPRHDLAWNERTIGWRVPMHRATAAEVLAPVWWSAADLALAAGRLRLRCCANPRCGWLFLDDSKAGTRRWCSMSACGNRAKVQRHALRQRSLDPVGPALTPASRSRPR